MLRISNCTADSFLSTIHTLNFIFPLWLWLSLLHFDNLDFLLQVSHFIPESLLSTVHINIYKIAPHDKFPMCVIFLLFTLFWRNIRFVLIYALLCGEKLIQKIFMWRKNDKYEVCNIVMAIYRPTPSIHKQNSWNTIQVYL